MATLFISEEEPAPTSAEKNGHPNPHDPTDPEGGGLNRVEWPIGTRRVSDRNQNSKQTFINIK